MPFTDSKKPKPRLFPSAVDHILCRQAGVKGLVFMTDEKRTGPTKAVIPSLPKGTIVIFREYQSLHREEKAYHIKKLCHQWCCKFFMAGDPNLALSIGADGCHLPQWLLPRVSNNIFKDLYISAACHDSAALEQAIALDADLIFISPVFPTKSHVGAPSLGIEGLDSLLAPDHIPTERIAALGGVNRHTASQLFGRNLMAVAAIDGVLAKDI